ncbi:MAG: chemotaxis protein CheX [Firmicutes bacterium]|nr:chemotaxis protein CheX [Bacillota bacterium]
MDKKYICPFVNSISKVFASFGLGKIVSGSVYKKDSFICKYNLTVIIGISGKMKGNIALSMPYDTAKRIASVMMMGMEITEIDEMLVSALGELTNIICGQAATEFSLQNLVKEVTPPTIVYGDMMKAVISQVETTVVELSTQMGNIELNLGLKI